MPPQSAILTIADWWMWCNCGDTPMNFNLVTGGAGFIGSHLVDALLSRGDKVESMDLRLNSYHDADEQFRNTVWDVRLPFELNPDSTIFHLAALADIVPSIEDPLTYFHTNITGTLNALEAARKSGCRKFVYAASASCYGKLPPLPTNENDGIYPQYPYALTKYMGEQLVLHYAQVYKLPVISLRLFNVYGTRARTTGTYGAMFGTFLTQIINNQPITIVGDGTQRRDFIHVSDVVRAFIKAADSDRNGIYNVGGGDPVSINDIANLLGAQERTYLPKRPGEPDITYADISKIDYQLGWNPEVSIQDGIKELLANIEHWKDAPLWDKEKIGQATAEWFKYLEA